MLMAMTDRIAQLRRAAGLSQSSLAAAAGIRPATLSEIETGKGNPRLETLQAIAAALRCSVADLFASDPLHADDAELLDRLKTISEDERRLLLRLLAGGRGAPGKASE